MTQGHFALLCCQGCGLLSAQTSAAGFVLRFACSEVKSCFGAPKLLTVFSGCPGVGLCGVDAASIGRARSAGVYLLNDTAQCMDRIGKLGP